MMAAPRIFRGWIVAWAAFVTMTVTFGIVYSFAAFFQPFSLEFDARRADVSWVFGLASIVYFWFGAIGGMLSDRFGPRVTGFSGMALVMASLFYASSAPSLSHIYLAWGAGVGLGVALIYTPSMGAVLPWFVRHRGLASGISGAGIGAGTLLVPVFATWLIAQMEWREAMRWLAVSMGLIGCFAIAFLERDPARRGLGTDGDPPRAPVTGAAQGSARGAGLTVAEAVRSPGFRWIYATCLFAGIPMFLPFAHLSASARDSGVAEAEAVALVGMIGVGSLVGRFGIGAIADRLGRLRTHLMVEAMLGASFLLWAIAEGWLAYAVFALVFGLSYGGIVSLLPPICSDLYGVRSVSGIIGLLYSGAGFGALLGPVIGGAIFDASGHYGWAIAFAIACAGLATACSWRILVLSDQPAGPAG
jgi:MFS family permease